MDMLTKLKTWASKLKRQLVLLHLAYQDDRTPLLAKVMIFLVIAYALSPIDLIPDFIPVIGYLDDLILLPIGIYLTIKLIPQEVITEAERRVEGYRWNKKNNWVIGGVILLLWLLVIYWVAHHYLIDQAEQG